MNLISAKQANLLVRNTEKYKKQMLADKVSKAISDAAMMGQQSVDIKVTITPEIMTKLVDLGYQVVSQDNLTTVIW